MSAPGIIEDDEIVAPWLYATLAADGPLTAALGAPDYIASDVAPTAWGDGPFVVFSGVSLLDVRGVGTARIMANDLWTVKAVGRGSTYDVVAPIARRIDALVSDAQATLAGGAILIAHRDGRVRYTESDEQGQTWCHLGGTYRIISQ
jgi:hypothetical protein